MAWNRNRRPDLAGKDRRSLDAEFPAGPEIDPAHAPVPSPGRVPDLGHLEDPGSHGTILAIFAGAKRGGRWEPPARLTVVSLFGGCDLDFCEAEMLEGETVVEIFALFGGAQIRVPPDIDVITEGIGIFGHFSQRDQRGEDSQPPRLRIRGLALFGGVDIKGPRKRGRLRRRRKEL